MLKVRSVISRLSGIMLALSLATLVMLGVGPRTGRYRVLTVLSGSMEPGIHAGSAAIVTRQPVTSLREGQILTYNMPEGDHEVVSHRVTRIIQAGLHPVVITKGDANEAEDPWVARIEDPTVWVVRGSIPGVGFVIHALRSRWAHIALVYGANLFFALAAISTIWRKARRPAVVVPLSSPNLIPFVPDMSTLFETGTYGP